MEYTKQGGNTKMPDLTDVPRDTEVDKKLAYYLCSQPHDEPQFSREDLAWAFWVNAIFFALGFALCWAIR